MLKAQGAASRRQQLLPALLLLGVSACATGADAVPEADGTGSGGNTTMTPADPADDFASNAGTSNTAGSSSAATGGGTSGTSNSEDAGSAGAASSGEAGQINGGSAGDGGDNAGDGGTTSASGGDGGSSDGGDNAGGDGGSAEGGDGGDANGGAPNQDGCFDDSTTDRAMLPPCIVFTLYNATTDQPIDGYIDVTDMVTISAADLTAEHTVRVNLSAGVSSAGSVVFDYDNTLSFHTENFADWLLFGNTGADYAPVDPAFSVGSHTIVATVWSGADGTGNLLAQMTLEITVTP